MPFFFILFALMYTHYIFGFYWEYNAELQALFHFNNRVVLHSSILLLFCSFFLLYVSSLRGLIFFSLSYFN